MSDQFDLFGGREERDKGMKRVSDNDPEWIDIAFAFCIRYLPIGWELTGETVMRVILDAGCPEPKHFNQRGALTAKLIRSGILKKTGRITQAKRKTRHASNTAIYTR